MKKETNLIQNSINYFPFGKNHRTFGQRTADKLTHFAGSWKFITGFLVVIIIWMILNIFALMGEWDPYPFILLNLALSCLAAIQAPIILMSQNRQNQKDGNRAKYDYTVNKKAEKEIREIKKQLTKIAQKIKKL